MVQQPVFRPVAGQHDASALPLVERRRRVLVGEADRGGAAGQVAVGHAHDRVLLVHGDGDAQRFGRAPHRHADVAAEAHHDVGLDLLEPALGRAGALLDGRDALDQRQGLFAVEPGCREPLERDARIRDELGLDARGRAREQDLPAPTPELLGQGECRINVAGGAAAGKNRLHSATSPCKLPRSFRRTGKSRPRARRAGRRGGVRRCWGRPPPWRPRG